MNSTPCTTDIMFVKWPLFCELQTKCLSNIIWMDSIQCTKDMALKCYLGGQYPVYYRHNVFQMLFGWTVSSVLQTYYLSIVTWMNIIQCAIHILIVKCYLDGQDIVPFLICFRLLATQADVKEIRGMGSPTLYHQWCEWVVSKLPEKAHDAKFWTHKFLGKHVKENLRFTNIWDSRPFNNMCRHERKCNKTELELSNMTATDTKNSGNGAHLIYTIQNMDW